MALRPRLEPSCRIDLCQRHCWVSCGAGAVWVVFRTGNLWQNHELGGLLVVGESIVRFDWTNGRIW
jgi:hypothetical protein